MDLSGWPTSKPMVNGLRYEKSEALRLRALREEQALQPSVIATLAADGCENTPGIVRS